MQFMGSQRVGHDLATEQQHAGAAENRQTEDGASSRPVNYKRAYLLHKVWQNIAKRRGWGNSSFGEQSLPWNAYKFHMP